MSQTELTSQIQFLIIKLIFRCFIFKKLLEHLIGSPFTTIFFLRVLLFDRFIKGQCHSNGPKNSIRNLFKDLLL